MMAMLTATPDDLPEATQADVEEAIAELEDDQDTEDDECSRD